MHAYQLGLYEKSMPKTLSWEEKFRAVQQAGFDYLEMSIDETAEKLARLDFDATQLAEIQVAMQRTGIRIGSICLSGHRKYPFGDPDKATRQKSLAIMQKAIQLASLLGIRTIQLAGYDVYYKQGTEETRHFFTQNLAKAVDMAARAGVMLGFETMETPFMDTVAKAMHYVQEIPSPYLGVYPDVGNLTNAALLYAHDKSDVARDMEQGLGHVVAVHLKETVPGKYREIPFGTGHVNFAAVTKKAYHMGVRRYVAELWDTGGDWQQAIAHASTFLRTFLDAAEREVKQEEERTVCYG